MSTPNINGTVSVVFQFNDVRTNPMGAQQTIQTNVTTGQNTYANGAGAGQVNQVFGYGGSNQRTFSGSTDVLDFQSGLTDAYGTAVVLVRFKGIYIKNTGNANIVVGGGTDPITTMLNSTGTFTLPPGAFLLASTPDATGYVVTASTAMNLLITGTSGQTYEIAVAGATS